MCQISHCHLVTVEAERNRVLSNELNWMTKLWSDSHLFALHTRVKQIGERVPRHWVKPNCKLVSGRGNQILRMHARSPAIIPCDPHVLVVNVHLTETRRRYVKNVQRRRKKYFGEPY